MTVTVFTKYRGTKEFVLAYSELVRAARERRVITYPEVAELMGLPPNGHYMGSETGHLLGEISEDEHGYGRPMLSAIATSVITGMPGPGFFKLARDLGKLNDQSSQGELLFWKKEKDSVYSVWTAPIERR